jgi:hypothetical protein
MRNDWEKERNELTQLLEGLSEKEVHVIGVQTLRNLKRQNQLQDGHVTLHSAFPPTFVVLLAAHRNITPKAQDFRHLFQHELSQPYLLPVFEFVMWLARVGLAWPMMTNTQTPITLRLTRPGERFVARTDDDHPLLPTYVERIKERSPGLPESVTSLLGQSKTCLDHALMRPAVSLMGVAYEAAIEEVIEKLIKRRKLTAQVGRALSAVDRIATVTAMIDTLLPGRGRKKAEERRAAHAAWDFADRLRSRRNDASHAEPAYGFDDREEAEELLVSAGRHLPDLWRVTRR